MVNSVLLLCLTPDFSCQELFAEEKLEITAGSPQIHTPHLDQNYTNAPSVGIEVEFIAPSAK